MVSIVVGLSAAGIAAITKLRLLDKRMHIIAISQEKELPYNKCFLADYVANIKSEQQVYAKPLDFFIQHNIELLLDTKVIGINGEQKCILLSSDAILKFDQLFIATGLTPMIPQIPGVKSKGVFVFQTLHDAHVLISFIKGHKPQQAVIVGAGLTGLEVADALLSHGIKPHVIERSSHVLSHLIDKKSATHIEHAMAQRDVYFYPQTSVVGILESNGNVIGVELDNGSIIKTKLVIVAVGARNTQYQMFQDVGIAMTNKGQVITNEYLQTNIPSIWAGGDIALIKNQLTNELVSSCTWPDAVAQGMVAGSCMAGEFKPYPGAIIITNSHFFGMEFLTCGSLINHPYQEVIIQKNNSYYKFLLDEFGILKSFCMLGVLEHISIIKGLLISKTATNAESLLSLFEAT